jgi:hypothetical protein
MNHVREIALRVAAELELNPMPFDPDAGKRYKRIALIDYASFLRKSFERTPEQNKNALGDALLYAEKSIDCGVPREVMEESFFRLRKFYAPRLKPNEVVP